MSTTDGESQKPGIGGRLLAGLRERIRWFVRMPVAEARVADLQQRVGDVQHRLHTLETLEGAYLATTAELRSDANEIRDIAQTSLGMAHEAAHTLTRSRLTLDDLARLSLIYQTMAWIEHAEVAEDLKITVITPSRNRAQLLARAVESVLASSYSSFELIVIDDGSTDVTPQTIEAMTDPRVVKLRPEGVGVCAARNGGLDAATGDVIAYLDDDNLFHPHWLRAIAWAMLERPDVDVLYGARVIDDYERVHSRPGPGLPWIQFHRFDRETIEQGNTTDMGVIAHRAGLADARFDPDLTQFGDWDLFLKLVEGREPLELPVIAGYYTTEAQDRLSETDTKQKDLALVLDHLAERRAATDGAGT